MRRSFAVTAGCLMLSLLAQPALAAQVRLDVSLANRTLLANKKQKTYVKVGLTGFRRARQEKRAPVNVAIVLDKSGSMQGEKIAKAKEAAIVAIQRLGRNDIVSVVAYDSTVRVIVPATKLTDKSNVIREIHKIGAGGSTALFAGVSKGADEIRKFIDKNRVNRVILLSDGLANVGPKSPSELAMLGKSLLKEGISVSTMGLGLGYNEDLMTQLAQKSGGNHVFIEKAGDLVRIFNYEFNDVLSVVAQEVAIEIKTASGIRPIRVLNMDGEINGSQTIVQLNQLYSEQEKYILLEVEVPPTKAGKAREIANVKVSYANLETKTTDRLSSSVSVRFSNSLAEVEKNTNPDVWTACVLQIANENSKMATRLRDRGDVAGARRVLMENYRYLHANGAKYKSKILTTRSADNRLQALKIDGKDWARFRKLMRQQQVLDATQQKYDGARK